MIKIVSLFLLLLISIPLFSQTKRQIDSLNNLSYETKVENAVALTNVYLNNAKSAERINYKIGEADSYNNLGLIYYYQGKYELHTNYILKAIALYELMNAKSKQAAAYASLGYSVKRRNMPKALYYMQKGKALAESQKLEFELRGIYDNYGVLKEMQNQMDSALYFYSKSLSLKEIAKDSLGIPYSLNNIGGIYAIKKKYTVAKDNYDRALNIRKLRNDRVGMAENYHNLGELYFLQGLFTEAISYYNQSLELCLATDYLFLAQTNYKKRAACYEALGNPIAALKDHKLYSKYKDSLLNKETNAKIAELEIRFETNKKEQLITESKNQILQQNVEAKERNILLWGVSFLALFVAIIGFLIFRQQKLKNRQIVQEHELKTAISKIETQNKLQDQRLSISRDLHDNIGAQLTFIISSVDNIKYAFDITNLKLETKLSSISNFTKDTILELRDTIWAMNSSEITFEDLRARILNFIEKAKIAKENVQFEFTIDPGLDNVKLSSVEGMNIYRTIQEAINNALKYAEAEAISITIQKEIQGISIGVSDNGLGFDNETVELGNGILNMEKRIEDIDGTFSIISFPLKGTQIHIILDKINV